MSSIIDMDLDLCVVKFKDDVFVGLTTFPTRNAIFWPSGEQDESRKQEEPLCFVRASRFCSDHTCPCPGLSNPRPFVAERGHKAAVPRRLRGRGYFRTLPDLKV
jgi:hypothetical protein